MTIREIQKICWRCGGTGEEYITTSIRPGGEQVTNLVTCTLCTGVGRLLHTELSEELIAQLNDILTKANDTLDRANDIYDKCIDIFEKCVEIQNALP
jgi:hypothetical protein